MKLRKNHKLVKRGMLKRNINNKNKIQEYNVQLKVIIIFSLQHPYALKTNEDENLIRQFP